MPKEDRGISMRKGKKNHTYNTRFTDELIELFNWCSQPKSDRAQKKDREEPKQRGLVDDKSAL